MATRGVDRERFEAYLDRLAEAVGHADRRWPFEAYLTGLPLPGRRRASSRWRRRSIRAT